LRVSAFFPDNGCDEIGTISPGIYAGGF